MRTLFASLALGVLLAAATLAPAHARPGPLRIPLEPYLRAQAVLHASVNGREGTFMFDTGEGITAISPEFAKKIGCAPWGQITGFRMSGERLDLPRCDDLSFSVGATALKAPVTGVLDIMGLMGDDVPPIDGAIGLDLFADHVITIVPRSGIILETPASLRARIRNARALPVRIVREAQGVALSVVAAVDTTKGRAWMELDSGNGGSLVIANHVAPLLGLDRDLSTSTDARFPLSNGISVAGKARTRDLIMDGNIGAQFLNNWILTLDLRQGRAWIAPMTPVPAH